MKVLFPQPEGTLSTGIGAISPPEWRDFQDDATGRRLTQLTSARGNSYPLYYFIPSITADGRYLIFHSERSGWVQLYRLDFTSGEIVQLTDGRTRDAGWAIWCEHHLRGIYNHLSVLDPVHKEVFYFQDDEIRVTHIETLANRHLASLPPGRVPVGQSAVSPDGAWLAFIHADAERFQSMLAGRESLVNMGLWDWGRHHHPFATNAAGNISLALVETATGKYREVLSRDFLFHHVLFLDDRTLLLNHPKDCNGMWTVDLDGGSIRHLRPHTAEGAHGAQPCHQIIGANGILYEANMNTGGKRRTYLGHYDPRSDTFHEFPLPIAGYVHTGNDPLGKFAFFEIAGEAHEIRSLHFPRDPARCSTRLIRTLAPGRSGQRYHAHPFLTPDREWILFTDQTDDGFSQIYRVHVADLVNRDEYW